MKKQYLVIKQFDEETHDVIFKGSWQDALYHAGQEEKPCYVVSKNDDELFQQDLLDEVKIRFTNKAWNAN